MVANVRPQGTFSRQLFLGDTLDPDGIEAEYQAGVLTLRIPISERAKPRKVEISSKGNERISIDA
jgi:HSP20 family protein